MTDLTTTLADRITGALLGTAAGDALGAGYEFSFPGPGAPIVMKGGGPFGFAAGEWTDDTAMMMSIAIAAETAPLHSRSGQDAVAREFVRWYRSMPKDVGNQTSRVLHRGSLTADAMAADAAATGPDNAGNGSLMRTAAVAAAYGADPDPARMLFAADQISRLTHTGLDTHLACQLWSYAIWWGIRHGTFDGLRAGLDDVIPDHDRGRWGDWIRAAETQDVPDFEHNNGWVVSALQTAWWGIHQARHITDPASHLRAALFETVRAGHDTDTTAAIAGGLLGAVHGATAVPDQWAQMLHGWPDATAVDIRRLAAVFANVEDASTPE
ncbi:ADP-ribosylglycohydrolase family protein [Prescottella subtropica]|uniref:ADP-ribosylglycohydrolase family protein n=1 Tax=Prescottella subtropica TaxID=2545757 RepID=UPI0010F647DE|nr:ADP-ribosylglycohydrolase family protein [Prescottella subtropica]